MYLRYILPAGGLHSEGAYAVPKQLDLQKRKMGFVPPRAPVKPKLGRLPFGKHQGELITDIAVTDPKYLHWLLEQEWLQKQEHLHTLICRALDIDETLLLRTPAALTTLRRYSRRITNDTEPKEKL